MLTRLPDMWAPIVHVSQNSSRNRTGGTINGLTVRRSCMTGFGVEGGNSDLAATGWADRCDWSGHRTGLELPVAAHWHPRNWANPLPLTSPRPRVMDLRLASPSSFPGWPARPTPPPAAPLTEGNRELRPPPIRSSSNSVGGPIVQTPPGWTTPRVAAAR